MDYTEELSKVFKRMSELPDELIIAKDYDSFTVLPVVEINQESLSDQELCLLLDVAALEERTQLPFKRTNIKTILADDGEACTIALKVCEYTGYSVYPTIDDLRRLYSRKKVYYKTRAIRQFLSS